jgi:hypothetical protein
MWVQNSTFFFVILFDPVGGGVLVEYAFKAGYFKRVDRLWEKGILRWVKVSKKAVEKIGGVLGVVGYAGIQSFARHGYAKGRAFLPDIVIFDPRMVPLKADHTGFKPPFKFIGVRQNMLGQVVHPASACGFVGIRVATMDAIVDNADCHVERTTDRPPPLIIISLDIFTALGSAISISPLYSINSNGIDAKFSKALSNDFNRLGGKWANRRLQ